MQVRKPQSLTPQVDEWWLRITAGRRPIFSVASDQRSEKAPNVKTGHCTWATCGYYNSMAVHWHQSIHR